MQLAPLSALWYRPASQDAHAAHPAAAAYWPDVHDAQAAVEVLPAVARYRPTEHRSHAEAPVAPCTVPAGHSVHVAAPQLAYDPAGQALQLAWPAELWARPIGHSLHPDDAAAAA